MAIKPFSKSPKPPLTPGLELIQLRARLTELEAREEVSVDHRTAEVGAIIDIPLELLSPNPWPSRIFVNAEAVNRLAQSIAKFGLLQPIAVRRHPERPDGYQIIAGGLRWRAVQELGRQTIRAVLIQATDAEMTLFSLFENIGREPYRASELSNAKAGL